MGVIITSSQVCVHFRGKLPQHYIARSLILNQTCHKDDFDTDVARNKTEVGNKITTIFSNHAYIVMELIIRKV